MRSILVNEGVEFHELIERRADAVAGAFLLPTSGVLETVRSEDRAR